MSLHTPYPHSSGLQQPAIAPPPYACDAHMHVHDPRYSSATDTLLQPATAADYRRLQARLGTQRTVVVQPRAHGTDNRATLAAILALGREQTRGVAVIKPEVSDKELDQLHAGGIRGIRFSLYTATHAVTDISMVEPLAHRIHALGWHVQLHWTAQQIMQHAALLYRLPSTVVFDHLARLPLPQGRQHPACTVVRRMLENGRTWIKLSGAYLDSQLGAAGGYTDLDPIARGWVTDAPQRMVWGSDWPHVTEVHAKPDDAVLFDLLVRWVPEARLRQQILVDNPAVLYDFPPVTTAETAP